MKMEALNGLLRYKCNINYIFTLLFWQQQDLLFPPFYNIN